MWRRVDNKIFYGIIVFLIIMVLIMFTWINYIYTNDQTKIGSPASANNTAGQSGTLK